MSETETVRLRWRFFGRVQGVGFRAFCDAAAREHGLPGWVRNEPDGSVTCEVEGPPSILARLKERLRSGNSWARVDQMDEAALAPRKDPREGFEIRA